MGSQGKKWIVRDGQGRIFGPFEVLKLRELLGRGVLTGDEEAAEYPAGDWRKLSSTSELYDIVLESLMESKSSVSARQPSGTPSNMTPVPKDQGNDGPTKAMPRKPKVAPVPK